MQFIDNDFGKMSKADIIQIWELMPHTKQIITEEFGTGWRKKSKLDLIKKLRYYHFAFDKDYDPYTNAERQFY